MRHLNAHVKKQYGLIGHLSMWFYGESNLKPIETFGGEGKGIQQIEKNSKTVHFESGQIFQDCDLIVFCTGYKQAFPFFQKNFFQASSSDSFSADNVSSSSSSDGNGSNVGGRSSSSENSGAVSNNSSNNSNSTISSTLPTTTQYYRHAPDEWSLPNEHLISYTQHPQVGFIGFARPNVGAIPPMSEIQVCWWLQNMKKRMTMKANGEKPTVLSARPSYFLLGNKYQYGTWFIAKYDINAV
jgi:hypothetical protein